MQRWLMVAGSTFLLIGGVICSLLAWICLSITSLNVSVAEIRKELELAEPQQVLRTVQHLESRVAAMEQSP